MNDVIAGAAKIIAGADAILIGAGAGMGVDSGLPDFRGNEGFWKAYPPMERLGLSFYDLADPVWFANDPERAWGFYGHRRNLYRQTQPHDGFHLLKQWTDSKPSGGFVFTSNVDGHFQDAGFEDDQIVECHGSIQFEQCSGPCGSNVWPVDDVEIDVDLDTFRAAGSLPKCRHCSRIARPNVLMFSDFLWIPDRTDRQHDRFEDWMESVAGGSLAVIEIGAGTAVPTVRRMCERIASRFGSRLVRINPREPQGRDTVSIPQPAARSISEIDAAMQ